MTVPVVPFDHWIAGSSAYSTSVDRRLALGQTMHVAGYTLTNKGVTRESKPNVTETRAHLAVSGPWSGTISSGDNQYVNPPEPSREVGIKTDWRRAEDLYVIVDESHLDTQVIYVQVLVKPLVNLIWVAGVVFLIGAAVAMWPDAREQRRLAVRLAPAAP